MHAAWLERGTGQAVCCVAPRAAIHLAAHAACPTHAHGGAWVGPLCGCSEPQCKYFWEAFFLFSRLFTVGFVRLIDQEVLRLQLGLMAVLVYALVLLYMKPYRRDDCDTLAIATQIALLGIFASALNIKLYQDMEADSVGAASRVLGYSSESQLSTGVFLLNLSVVLLFLLFTAFQLASRGQVRHIRLESSRHVPDAMLHVGKVYHLFLSHIWSSGQDQVRPPARPRARSVCCLEPPALQAGPAE